jgi:nucleoside phosphorylase
VPAAPALDPEPEPFGCRTLLFVATPDELDELRAAAGELTLPFTPIERESGTYYNLGQIGAGKVYVRKISMGAIGFEGSAARSIYCSNETGASNIVCVGMGFGVDPARQRPGDVLVSSSLLPYDLRRIRSDAGLPKYDYGNVHAFPAAGDLLRIFRRERERTERPYAVHVGAMLTGAAHISCRAYRDHLVARCARDERIVGGEMEGAGILSLSAKSESRWIIAKGIIDFADEDRDRVYQNNRKSACRNAARFALEALTNERK